MLMAQERRSHPRKKEKHKLRLFVQQVPHGVELRGKPSLTVWTNDVSYGGLQFTSRRVFPVGTVIKLDVECTRPHETFRHVGQVVWVRGEKDGTHHTLGVYFTETPIRVLNAWSRHLTAAATM